MTDKKTFGSFIKSKRIEKNYSQKDLAEMLFVTEGAVSKWERGVSYPDITMISDICHALDISEHELITASTDTDTRRIKQEARNFRVIRGAWFWIPTISYSVAILVCFICNLAVSRTLSWFFIVLAALLCAYSFVPTFTCFFKSKRLLVFSATSFSSICLLLMTCALYTNNLSWLLNACIGVLIGYEMVFIPILLSGTRAARFKIVISFCIALALTVLLLFDINLWQPFMLRSAILIACYAFAPAILCAVICAFRFDTFLKVGVCVALCAVALFPGEYLVDRLFGINENSYQVNFCDWNSCAEGNLYLISFVILLAVSAAVIGVGIFRLCKNKKL